MIKIANIQHLEKAKKYPAGEVLLSPEQNDQLIILLRGSASVTAIDANGEARETKRLNAGDYYGTNSLLFGATLESRVTALTDVIVLPVARQRVLDFIQKEPHATLALMTDFATQTNEALLAVDYFQSRLDSRNPSSNDTKSVPAPSAVPVNAKTATAVANAAAVGSKSAASSPTGEPGFAGTLTDNREQLFPPGHTFNELPVNNDNAAGLMEKGYTCPMCKHTFRTLRIKRSKLVPERTDDDYRTFYKGIEPMHYDVVSCPSCLYSALDENFADGRKLAGDYSEIVKPFVGNVTIGLGMARDTMTIFAGYYLAILCAPKCFLRPLLITSKLMVKLSRLYKDLGNADMDNYITAQALAEYLKAYEKIDMDNAQAQQVCVMIGEQYLRTGNLIEAKKFFFKAKTELAVTPEMTRHADDRLERVRELEAESKEPKN